MASDACGTSVGTTSGASRHYAVPETPCEPCRAARRDYERAYRDAWRELAARYPADYRAYFTVAVDARDRTKQAYVELARARRPEFRAILAEIRGGS